MIYRLAHFYQLTGLQVYGNIMSYCIGHHEGVHRQYDAHARTNYREGYIDNMTRMQEQTTRLLMFFLCNFKMIEWQLTSMNLPEWEYDTSYWN